MTAAGLLADARLDITRLRGHIDGLAPDARVAEVVSLSASLQKRLWEITSAAPALDGTLLSPGSRSTVFAGRNSLRLWTRFEKSFTRLGTSTVGYNRHPLSWLIGPGYFTVEPDQQGQLRFDYDRVPPETPPGWPAVVANAGTFSGAVYGHLSDRVAWVAADVLIGAAYRLGRPLDSYFVLARRPG